MMMALVLRRASSTLRQLATILDSTGPGRSAWTRIVQRGGARRPIPSIEHQGEYTPWLRSN